jgi:hypothetical protein
VRARTIFRGRQRNDIPGLDPYLWLVAKFRPSVS